MGKFPYEVEEELSHREMMELQAYFMYKAEEEKKAQEKATKKNKGRRK